MNSTDIPATPTPGSGGAPDGFKPLSSGGNDLFVGINGPLYRKREDDRLVLGMRVQRRHCNPMGICHGGMLMTFADMAMAMAITYQEKLGRFVPTISMSTDFLGPAPDGAWIEGRTDVLRKTRNMVFTQCLISIAGASIVRASGVFKIGPEFVRRAREGDSS